MEWVVVTVLVTLAGLFITIGKPILDLNRNIVTLNVNLEHYKKRLEQLEHRMDEAEVKAHSSHSEIWEEIRKQLNDINAIASRIGILEHDKGVFHHE